MRVYFDATVYVNRYVEGKENEYERAFNKIKNGEYQLMVSTINLLEIRRRISRKRKFAKLENWQIPKLSQEVDDKYNDIVEKICDDLGIIDRHSLHDIGEDEMEELAKDIHRLCENDFYELGGIIGSADVLQLKSARNLGCSMFITEDMALLELEKHNLFSDMDIAGLDYFLADMG